MTSYRTIRKWLIVALSSLLFLGTVNFSFGTQIQAAERVNVTLQSEWDGVIRVEGEDFVTENFPTSEEMPHIISDDMYSGGRLLRLETPIEAPDGGYIATYEVVSPVAGAYRLEIASTPQNETWASPYSFSINDGEYETAAGAKLIADINDTVRRYEVKVVQLQEGSNTFAIHVDTVREMDQKYTVYLDVFTFTLLPLEEETVLQVEGENFISENFPDTETHPQILLGDAYSGGRLLRLETPNEVPAGGYIATYEVVSPIDGSYRLEIASTPPEELWTSPYSLSINDAEYEPVTGVKQIADIDGTVRRYEVKNVKLKEGSNTFAIKVDTRRKLDGQYTVYLDQFIFNLLPFGLQSVHAETPFKVFEASESVVMYAPFMSAAPDQGSMDIKVTDYWGDTVLDQSFPYETGDDQVILNLGALPLGHYTVTAAIANSLTNPEHTFIAVVPPYSERDHYDDTPFALDGGFSLHVNHSKISSFADALQLSGVKWVRDRFHWGTTNPAPNVYDYSYFAPILEAVSSKGISILTTYQEAPAWTHTTEGSVPDNLLAAYQFTADAGAELGDFVGAWEIGNEPDGHYTGVDETGDQYAAYLKAAAIGYLDSGADSKISIAGFADHPNEYIKLVMDNEVLPFLDIYSYHGYPLPYDTHETEIVPFPANAYNHLAFIHQYEGADQVAKWMTEAGLILYTGITRDFTRKEQQGQARYLVTSAVQSIAEGTDKHFWFFMPYYLEHGSQYGIFNQNDAPYAAYMAISAFTDVMGEGRYLGAWEALPADVQGHRFANGRDETSVFWSEQPQQITINVNDEDVQLINLMGNPIPGEVRSGQLTFTVGHDPVYLRQSLASQAASRAIIQVDRSEKLTAAERVVISQRYSNNARSNAKLTNAYQLNKDQPNVVEVDVYNFNNTELTGIIKGTAEGGWVLDQAAKSVTIAPYAMETVTFTLTANSSITNAKRNAVTFHAQFGDDVSTASLAYVMTGLQEVQIKPIVEAGVPTNWDFDSLDAAPPTATYHVEAGTAPGSITFKYQFSAANQWIYPYLALPNDLDLTKESGIALEIYSEVEIANTDLKIMLVEQNGGKYYTLNGFKIKAGMNRFVVPFGMFSRATFGPPDPNAKLDLDQVEQIQIGINTQLYDVPLFTLLQLGTFAVPANENPVNPDSETPIAPPYIPPVVSPPGTAIILAGDSGRVELGEKVMIEIPVGASDKMQRLSIQRMDEATDVSERLLSFVYDVSNGLDEKLLKPATVTLYFDAQLLGKQQRAAVFRYDAASNIWVELDGIIEGDKAIVALHEFGRLAVLAVDIARETAPTPLDVKGHWAEKTIQEAMAKGLVRGYTDGTFKPDSPITRAEFVLLLTRIVELPGSSQLSFTDQNSIGKWAEEGIAKALHAGIIQGYEDGNFRPEAAITRSELVIMLIRALKLPTKTGAVATFTDQAEIPDWAKSSVAAAEQAGMVKGVGGNRFAPTKVATRAEGVTLLLRVYEALEQVYTDE